MEETSPANPSILYPPLLKPIVLTKSNVRLGSRRRIKVPLALVHLCRSGMAKIRHKHDASCINEYTVLELDTSEKKWVYPKNTIGYAYLVNALIHGAYIAIKHPDRTSEYGHYDYFDYETGKIKFFKTWYFSYPCFNVDIIHDS
ncbi:hypothetical protein L1887_18027 [Cichorium endivia]|nr:hypothetical protein L1887_18027 [Cichorium endivia]